MPGHHKEHRVRRRYSIKASRSKTRSTRHSKIRPCTTSSTPSSCDRSPSRLSRICNSRPSSMQGQRRHRRPRPKPPTIPRPRSRYQTSRQSDRPHKAHSTHYRLNLLLHRPASPATYVTRGNGRLLPRPTQVATSALRVLKMSGEDEASRRGILPWRRRWMFRDT